MCRLRTKPIARAMTRPIAAVVAGIALGTTLGGCSDLYSDRRDAVALSAGDAVAANEVAQIIDPWPAQSGNTNIATNGQRMQSSIEHYRTNTGVQPVDPMLMEVVNASPPAAQNSSQAGNGSAPAPPSIAPGTATTTTTVITSAPTPTPSQ